MELLMSSGGSSSTESPPLSVGGLRFGQKIYFEDGSGSGTGSSKNLVVTGRKSSKGRCQVEGCKMDLSNAKAYYLRHKVCCFHSKSTKVIVSGLHQRFCQQCSRFHQLSEFDLEKRSCRRRLACHNQRRRKPQPSRTLLTSRYARIAPSLYGNADSATIKSVLGDSAAARSMMRLPGPWQSDPERESHQLMNVFSNGSSRFSITCPVMMNNNSTESNCALSLLSNSNSNQNQQQPQQLQTSANIWRPSSGFDSVDRVTLARSPPTPIHSEYLNHTFEFKAVEKSILPQYMSPALGLSQISEPADFQISELSLHQQVLRQHMEPENTKAYGSFPQIFNWSL